MNGEVVDLWRFSDGVKITLIFESTSGVIVSEKDGNFQKDDF